MSVLDGVMRRNDVAIKVKIYAGKKHTSQASETIYCQTKDKIPQGGEING